MAGGTDPERARQERAALLEKHWAADARATRRRRVLAGAGAVTAVAAVAALVTVAVINDPPPQAREDIEIAGLQTFEGLGNSHVETAVDYEQSPPVGGDHASDWLNCGVYTEPVPEENAVHALEHGAVWAAYDPSALSEDQAEALRQAVPDTYVVLSPYEDLGAPIMVSAWGAQVALDSPEDERLEQFVTKYWQSPDAPEPGASCTGGIDAPQPGRMSTSTTGAASRSLAGHRGRWVLLVLAAVLLVAAGWAVGQLSAPRSSTPAEGSPEAGFARDMQTHHLQAVEMSSLVRDRTEDPEIRRLAYDISRTQQQQVGQMYGWLSVWGLPQASSQPTMAWMDDGAQDHTSMPGMDSTAPGLDARMPGMATAEQLAELQDAQGRKAERLYLELMIPHHQAGATMAQAILERTDHPVVTSLAQSIATSQTSEIDYMEDLLAERRTPS